MASQKITIEPVTRIEGHAKVTIHTNESGGVDRAYLHINEFRGFEKFCEGRLVQEMPSITPRICGICPVSHHLAAAKAADDLFGVQPPRPANLLRELMHLGQVIQSHGMHFFELAGPDLLLGFDADPESRNVLGLLSLNPELARRAIGLRKFGQQIIQILGGRRIHPVFAVPGGVNKSLKADERAAIQSQIGEAIATLQIGLKIVKDWAEQNGEQLERFQGSRYLDYIAEHTEKWSYLKFPYYKKFGWPDGVYRVGPLGRLNVAGHIGAPLAHSELEVFKALNDGRPVENTLYYHYARLIEALFAVERAGLLLDDPDILSTDIIETRQNFRGEGVGVLEAPRGTLIHHYWAKEDGVIEKVNLIVATGHNNWAMCEAVDSVAKTYITGAPIQQGWLNRVEAAVRAYDPCLSCSTHAIGQMPLIVEVRSPEGELIQALRRDG
jgi:NAD-reducing hydrogenase large subunit